MVDKDLKKIGKLNYPDFSKWLGSSIHMSESFYFRHDSIKNPGYEACLDKSKLKENDKKRATDFYYDDDIEKKILEKIKF